jgi:3-oxoacyl-[acyl-carrier-protein] synthase-1
LEPITMALFPDEELPPLAEPLETVGLTARQRRIIRLAAAPLQEVLACLPAGSAPPPLFLGLPEARAERISAEQVVPYIAGQAGATLDEKNSRVFPRGRAAALLALESAAVHLAKGRVEHVLVGGVDTYLDLAILAELDQEERILGTRVMDGFVPGEGAAFLLLTSSRSRPSGRAGKKVQVLGVGSARDPGHRYSDKPARGEGLGQALEKLYKDAPSSPAAISSIYAGFNGESFAAKEWGVARLRHNERFAHIAPMEHPADCYGDAGAATGALLLALAHRSLTSGARVGPALVFASSDSDDRACALVDLLT